MEVSAVTENAIEIGTQPEATSDGVATDFIRILQKVKADAQLHRTHLISNEGVTRSTLIDPVLRALGWEISDPNSAIVEARARRGTNVIFADYALMAGSTPRFIVEAKALGQDLKSHRNQVVDYAFAFQINNVFLTNGLVWEHFTNLNPRLLAPTKILNLGTDQLEMVAGYLSQELQAIATSEAEQAIAHLYERAERLLTEFETVTTRISTLEIESSRQPLTAALSARIAALQRSLRDSPEPLETSKPRAVESVVVPAVVALIEDLERQGKAPFFRASSALLYSKLKFIAGWQRLGREYLLNARNPVRHRGQGVAEEEFVFDQHQRAELANAPVLELREKMSDAARERFDKEAFKAIEHHSAHWPIIGVAMRELSREAATLRAVGIIVGRARKGNGAPWIIERTPAAVMEAV